MKSEKNVSDAEKQKVFKAIESIIGELKKDRIVLRARLRDDLEMESFERAMLAYDLGLDFTDIEDDWTVQDVVNFVKQKK